jgi:outer membrane PBP1 activator LpoA protein
MSLMAVIVGAACQPLQPPDSGAALNAGGRAGQAGPTTVAITTESINPAEADAPLVALLVPLSGRQQALGMAIRDGFIAAHLEAPGSRRFTTLIIDEARTSVAEAHRQALDAGARALVGPLLKESVQALAPIATQMAGPLPGQMPVLALNNLADAGALWQFGLAPEDEAREIAIRALALGQRRALLLVPSNEWGQRLLDAFGAEFSIRGGSLVDTRTYTPGTTDFTVPIRSLLQTTEPAQASAANGANPAEKPSLEPGRRQDADLIFVAANSSNGRQIMPQLRFFGARDLPTYSTSAIWEDGTGDDDDLNGVIFPDCPWVIAPDGRAALVRNQVVRHWGKSALGVSRFYALGYDAYQLLPEILQQRSPGPFASGEIAGATGLLSADATGRIHRRLFFAEIRGGRPMPLPAVAPPAEQITGQLTEPPPGGNGASQAP